MTASPSSGINPRRYRNPPIVEAICEIRFDSDEVVDGQFRDAMRSRLAGEYPGQSRIRKSLNLDVALGDSGPPVVNQSETEERLQLFDVTETRLVAFSPQILSIHMLAPYHLPGIEEPSGWAEFRPRIMNALSCYWNVAKPHGAIRISLRYINRIALPARTVNIQDFLTCAIASSPKLPEVVTNFISQFEFRYPDGAVLALSQGSAPTPDNQPGFLLDLDIIQSFAQPSGLDLVEETLDELRSRERIAFEACITDQARELFDAAPS
ncbi:MAG: TIGR04255 family protein [Chloroflexi bacterium]|nr:TIGR04255 family protein [Chloroflexota bacterium]